MNETRNEKEKQHTKKKKEKAKNTRAHTHKCSQLVRTRIAYIKVWLHS